MSKCGLIESKKTSGCNLRGRVKLLRSEITFSYNLVVYGTSQDLVCVHHQGV